MAASYRTINLRSCPLRNKGLLSFGDEPEEPVDPLLAKTKFKSSHDALDDPRLSKEVRDDRGTSSTLPPGMEGPARKRKGDGDERSDEVRQLFPPLSELALTRLSCSQKRSKMDVPTKAEASTSKLVAARAAKEQAAPNPKSVFALGQFPIFPLTPALPQ